MVKATWNGVVLAESDRTSVVEGNHYFPPDSLHAQYFKPSATHTICSWKGTASYYHIEANAANAHTDPRYNTLGTTSDPRRLADIVSAGPGSRTLLAAQPEKPD